MTPAFLIEEERGIYAMYRQIEVEDPATGQREKKGEKIGPIIVFRVCEKGEKADYMTVHPTTGMKIDLKTIEDNRPPTVDDTLRKHGIDPESLKK